MKGGGNPVFLFVYVFSMFLDVFGCLEKGCFGASLAIWGF